ncbi:MAG: hypothetical protein CO034_02750 [Parcubacteria group bacterium CG_4_9_14_0_2_um_filter_35_11]|nr:MAG: hypothetical protein CO034_02750 [Parcubacteria group bacterium CG_4_9_14_0_2_um_filter_35_11]
MKNKKIVVFAIIIIGVVLAFYLVFAWGQELWPFAKGYQVVSLANGAVYYGHLSFFPSPRMVDVWLFQQTTPEKKEETPQLNLIPFTSLFFGPKNVLYLEKEQIIWWADLEKDSSIVKFIESQKGIPTTLPQEQSPQQPQK